MKTYLILAAIAASVATLSWAAQEPAPAPKPTPEEPSAQIGDDAPAFTLNDHAGALASIGGESESWTVLAFYPKALTGG